MNKKVKRKNYTENGVIVDTKTGEIVQSSEAESRVILEEITYDDTSKFQKNVTFVKMFRGSGSMLFKELTHAELSLVVFLCDFICYEDCALRTNGNSQGKLLTIQDIADLSDVKYNTVRKTIYSLRDKQLIGFHQTGSGDNAIKMITVNPYVFCRGINVSDWVIGFYSKTKWALMDKEYVRDGR